MKGDEREREEERDGVKERNSYDLVRETRK